MDTPAPTTTAPSSLWTPASALSKQSRWSVDLWGGGGSGKSHLSIFTAPGPLFIANFDRDPSQLIKRSGRDDVFVCNLHAEGLWLTDGEARKVYANFEAALKDATSMKEGTFLVDGGSAMHHLLEQIALADYNDDQTGRGKDTVERLPSLQRASINSRILNLLASVSQTPVNFIITHQQRQVWSEDGRPTDKYEARENTQIEYGVDISVMMFTNWRSAGKGKPPELKHYGKIVLCKHDDTLINMTLENPTFELIAGMLEG